MRNFKSVILTAGLICCFFASNLLAAFPKPAEGVTLSAANGGQLANVNYFHRALWNIATIDYPANENNWWSGQGWCGSLDAPINMEYLLNAIDNVNRNYLHTTTTYKSVINPSTNEKYANKQAVPKAAVDYAIQAYLKGKCNRSSTIWNSGMVNSMNASALLVKFINSMFIIVGTESTNALCHNNPNTSPIPTNFSCFNFNKYSYSPKDVLFDDIVYGNGSYVAFKYFSNNQLYVSDSTNLSNWNTTSYSAISPISIMFGGGNFIIIRAYLNNFGIYASTTGLSTSWTSLNIPQPVIGGYLTSAAFSTNSNERYGEGRYVAITVAGQTAYSDSLYSNWTNGNALIPSSLSYPTNPDSSKGPWDDVVYGASRFFAFSKKGYIVSSCDGINWTFPQQVVNNTNLPDYSGGSCNSTSNLSDVSLTKLSFSDGMFLINYASVSNPTNCNGVYLSNNGINWIPVKANQPSFHNATFGNGWILAAGSGNTYYYGLYNAWTCNMARKVILSFLRPGSPRDLSRGVDQAGIRLVNLQCLVMV